MLGGALAMMLTAGFEALGAAFDERGWARASMWSGNLTLLAWLVIFGKSSLILDTARVFLIRRDDGRAAAAVKQALGFLWRNVGGIVVMAAAFLVLLAVTIAIYNLIAGSITPLSWGLIAFTIIWQQVFTLTRTTLRVGFLATLAEFVDARTPRPVEPPAVDITPMDEPVYELPLLS
jgi:hypothetical protein